ncbi:type II toxin-antitoxin system RelE/ParE family toxin [Pseudorhodoferax soli]|uniref:Toxin ParE1/3/4 n=1 Tax=Pseudorhodoferax soli TaxID=545864 RepID=A0A368Y3T5_9BURK|nr:type II toxin-antitoxin system RelE/ParE family toxin [Pseudorhodoferax soli]RCW72894.1 toxin ParE1/3/4 [Pseudorhodoferax soli]
MTTAPRRPARPRGTKGGAESSAGAYLLSPQAIADLSEIWDYSAREWGTAQADRYVMALRDACGALASGPMRGQSAEHIRAGYRRQIVGTHVMFFRVGVNGVIDVVRILHQRMDVGAQLALVPPGPRR